MAFCWVAILQNIKSKCEKYFKFTSLLSITKYVKKLAVNID